MLFYVMTVISETAKARVRDKDRSPHQLKSARTEACTAGLHIALQGLEMAADEPVALTVVEDRLEVAAARDAVGNLWARETADVDLAGDNARAVRADVVVLMALATQLPERRCAVVHRRTSVGRLAHGLGLIRARARC